MGDLTCKKKVLALVNSYCYNPIQLRVFAIEIV